MNDTTKNILILAGATTALITVSAALWKMALIRPSIMKIKKRWGLSSKQASLIYAVAYSAGIKDPVWLADLIAFESAGTFDPRVQHGGDIPETEDDIDENKAIGIFQLVGRTMRHYGLTHKEVYNMTFAGQMSVLSSYLNNIKKGRHWHDVQEGPYDTKQSVYYAVFNPKYRKSDPQTPLDSQTTGNNPVSIVADYTRAVDRWVANNRKDR
jgi:hypothetical protein